MAKIGLIVDSTFTISEALAKKHDISIIPLTVFVDGQPHLDGTITVQQLEQAFLEDKDFKTSQPTPESYVKAYEEKLKTYDELLVLTLAKNLSGTFNSATLAKETLEQPERVTIVDTESTGAGGLYFVESVLEKLKKEATVSELVALCENIKLRGFFFVTVDDLKYLIKGGRITKTKAFIGNLLKKKPILKFKDGKLGLDETVRSFIGVKDYIYEQAKGLIESTKKTLTVYINYVNDIERAQSLKEKLSELGKDVKIQIVGLVSPVVSAHVGLGALGIYLVTE